MITAIIPAYREPYLQKTIDSLLKNTSALIIPVLDGWRTELRENSRVTPIMTENKGMRNAINTGVKAAKTKYIMKVDAHCDFSSNFDEILDFPDNWLMIPRRYSLNVDTWTKDERRKIKDYHYIYRPGSLDKSYGETLQNADWKKNSPLEIDDTMTFQGSCWVANREYFTKHIGLLDDIRYGKFAHEWLEIGMKYWLGGGAIKVNKKVWYAHLNKRPYQYKAGLFSHKYKKNEENLRCTEWATKHWMNNEEPGMIHDFNWLIDKFKPPTWYEKSTCLYKQ
jgi:glycosyltransferase involved in cell wall biosynthesis